MRLGRKATTEHLVVYLNNSSDSSKPRFGFVVGKTVGNAVERNLVKRRARAAMHERLGKFSSGDSLVIRALPGCAKTSWSEICSEIDLAISRLKADPK